MVADVDAMAVAAIRRIQSNLFPTSAVEDWSAATRRLIGSRLIEIEEPSPSRERERTAYAKRTRQS